MYLTKNNSYSIYNNNNKNATSKLFQVGWSCPAGGGALGAHFPGIDSI